MRKIKDLKKGFWFSLVVHTAVLSIMVFCMRNAPSTMKRTIDIDLALKKFTEEPPPPPQEAEEPPEPVKAPELPKNILSPKTPGQPRQTAAPPQGPQTQSGDSVPVDAPENSGRAPFQLDSGSGYGDGEGGDTLTDYHKEQFNYIRGIVMQHMKYPEEAQSKGMEGKVIVSFVILEDGSVRDIKVISSSGYDLLDKNALETVRNSAPFPKPPANAELQLPINYVLET